jgi:UDP-N-acetylmuramate dehydrogenase
MDEFQAICSNRHGGFKTSHRFRNFAVFRSVEEYTALVNVARDHHLPVYILGKGSNTYFASRTVHTAVLKNELPETIEIVEQNDHAITVDISSSTSLMKVLRFCEKNELESFYFLASVPGNVGGSLAMNAGGPKGTETIFDFLDQVTVCDSRSIRTVPKSEIPIGHRHTPFAGQHEELIASARFTFRRTCLTESPVRKRIDWYKTHQDTSGPSLGSVFKDGNGYVFGALKRLNFGMLGSHWSSKYGNWIVCKRGSLLGIRLCIFAARFLHVAIGRRIELEVIKVK